MSDILLSVQNLHAYYGKNHVLHGVDISVNKGETIGLMGRNGMGKSTLLKSIMGLGPLRTGTISFLGSKVTDLPPHEIMRNGIAYVPEGRGIFSTLSTLENLLMSSRIGCRGRHDWTLDGVLEIFPSLVNRLSHGGGQLSGGEQQMLSIGRALMTNPDLLILDEATEGLAPRVASDIWKTIDIVRDAGVAVIVVDKNLSALSAITNKIVILVKGELVFNGLGEKLINSRDLQLKLLGI